MLRMEQWTNLQTGNLMRGFSVYNRKNQSLAIGAIAFGADAGFCLMHAKRYEHDADLVNAVEKLTGIKVRMGGR